MSMAPVVVCDPGVDDFLALLVLAGAGSPPRAIIGTGGNVGADLAFRNALGAAALLGLECPVAKGVDSGLVGPYPDTGDPFTASTAWAASALPFLPTSA